MESKLEGYRELALKLLKEAKASIGAFISVTRNGEYYEGILIPRSEYSDDNHLLIKLGNGYNVGLLINSSTKINVIKSGSQPKFVYSPPPTKKKDLGKVAIISTGGTIASRVDYRTGAVEPALTADDLHASVPELSDIATIDTQILYSELSENLTPNHWSEMAKTVAKRIDGKLKGIVLCHGTDTMAYSSAALSFALQNLPIPIVLVGSQRSSDRPSSDAASNLVGAVSVANHAPFAEVVVAMHETISDGFMAIHRGARVRKCHTSGRDAFQTVNSPIFARYDLERGNLAMNESEYSKREHLRKVMLKPNFNDKVMLIKFHPGMESKIIELAIRNGYLGMIIEGTGLGHIGKYLHNAVKLALDSGLLVGMTSQCIWGRVNMNVYYTGRDLLAMGIIPLDNMLSETALVKMMWAFGQTNDKEEIKSIMKKNIAWEFSQRVVRK